MRGCMNDAFGAQSSRFFYAPDQLLERAANAPLSPGTGIVDTLELKTVVYSDFLGRAILNEQDRSFLSFRTKTMAKQ